ncbi:hypothetical protein [Agrobacterium rosae]|uniref:hypothetical protein n=1 Tax=Agrobacterium rosae TaxID=1972867 RepID=UPI003B9EFA7B
MKFKITAKITYWWPIIVRVPDTENPGKFVEQKLKVQFEPKSRDDANEAMEAAAKLTTQKEKADHEEQQLLDVVKNWDEVEDEDKNPIPFSSEMFLAAMQRSWFRTGVYSGYADSLSGIEARLGN